MVFVKTDVFTNIVISHGYGVPRYVFKCIPREVGGNAAVTTSTAATTATTIAATAAATTATTTAGL